MHLIFYVGFCLFPLTIPKPISSENYVSAEVLSDGHKNEEDDISYLDAPNLSDEMLNTREEPLNLPNNFLFPPTGISFRISPIDTGTSSFNSGSSGNSKLESSAPSENCSFDGSKTKRQLYAGKSCPPPQNSDQDQEGSSVPDEQKPTRENNRVQFWRKPSSTADQEPTKIAWPDCTHLRRPKVGACCYPSPFYNRGQQVDYGICVNCMYLIFALCFETALTKTNYSLTPKP